VRTVVGIPRTRSSAVIADGTVLISVGATGDASPGTASAFSTSTTAPPNDSVTNSSNTDRSKHTDVDAITPASSASVNTVRAHAMNATALRCAMATPFGRPVDPEV